MKLLPGNFGAAVLLLSVLTVRAQITESPLTVKPGRFLLEMDAVSIGVSRGGVSGEKYHALGVANTLITTGLTDRWDIQVGAELFLSQKFDHGGLTDRHSGLGDVYLRSKWNFWLDEAGGSAVAVIPYVKLPTNTGGVGKKAIEGGLIIPWSQELSGGTLFSAMGQWDLVRNDADNGYDSYWSASATVDRKLTKAVGVYGEATMAKSSSGAPWEGALGVGATLAITEGIWWDYGVYRGLSRGATDWHHVLRFNWGF